MEASGMLGIFVFLLWIMVLRICSIYKKLIDCTYYMYSILIYKYINKILKITHKDFFISQWFIIKMFLETIIITEREHSHSQFLLLSAMKKEKAQQRRKERVDVNQMKWRPLFETKFWVLRSSGVCFTHHVMWAIYFSSALLADSCSLDKKVRN